MNDLDPRYTTRIEGPTPNGGVASVAFWLDAEGNPCRKDEAHEVEIHELDAHGGSIFRTYGRLDGKPYPDL